MGHRRVTAHLRAARGGWALPGAAVALLSISLGSVLLAACGSVPAPGSGAAPAASGGAASRAAAASPSPNPSVSSSPGNVQTALCRDTSTVTSLRIVRAPGPRVPQVQAVFPGQVIVTSSAHAQQVARALCALPAMPHGVMSCPAMFPGTTYQLTFTADGKQLAPVNIDATGCQIVTGVGQVRRIVSSGFWNLLANVAGISPPGRGAFINPNCPPPKSDAKIDGCPAQSGPAGGAQSGSAAVS
jgi:hypothetical protein